MKRTAVFVDAGYLYAQGSACLQGSKARRENLQLAHDLFVAKLVKLSEQVQPSSSLLRIYWYDGTSRGPTQDHRVLADLDNLKLRLGFINSVGQQKGVDSLLVTDLVELARNGAICDALLLGGDEDLRIGVQIAQSFGVRVHLIGIEPSRGSQSLQLRQEADTKHEISSVEIATFLKLLAPAPPSPIAAAPTLIAELSTLAVLPPPATLMIGLLELEEKLREGIQSVLQRLNAGEVADLSEAVARTHSVPMIHDRRILASCRTSLGRDLTMDEKKIMRNMLQTTLKQ